MDHRPDQQVPTQLEADPARPSFQYDLCSPLVCQHPLRPSSRSGPLSPMETNSQTPLNLSSMDASVDRSYKAIRDGQEYYTTGVAMRANGNGGVSYSAIPGGYQFRAASDRSAISPLDHLFDRPTAAPGAYDSPLASGPGAPRQQLPSMHELLPDIVPKRSENCQHTTYRLPSLKQGFPSLTSALPYREANQPSENRSQLELPRASLFAERPESHSSRASSLESSEVPTTPRSFFAKDHDDGASYTASEATRVSINETDGNGPSGDTLSDLSGEFENAPNHTRGGVEMGASRPPAQTYSHSHSHSASSTRSALPPPYASTGWTPGPPSRSNSPFSNLQPPAYSAPRRQDAHFAYGHPPQSFPDTEGLLNIPHDIPLSDNPFGPSRELPTSYSTPLSPRGGPVFEQGQMPSDGTRVVKEHVEDDLAAMGLLELGRESIKMEEGESLQLTSYTRRDNLTSACYMWAPLFSPTGEGESWPPLNAESSGMAGGNKRKRRAGSLHRMLDGLDRDHALQYGHHPPADGSQRGGSGKKKRAKVSPEPASTKAEDTNAGRFYNDPVRRPIPVTWTARRDVPAGVPYDEEFPRFYRAFPVPSAIGPKDPIRSVIEANPEAARRMMKPPSDAVFHESSKGYLDLYAMRYSIGSGGEKVGLCPICCESRERGGEEEYVWQKTKVSAYNYHMSYYHGISNITGLPFSPPVDIRAIRRPGTLSSERMSMKEGKCHECKKWIPLQGVKTASVKVKELYWFRHAKTCHKTRIEGGVFIRDALYDILSTATPPQPEAQPTTSQPTRRAPSSKKPRAPSARRTRQSADAPVVTDESDSSEPEDPPPQPAATSTRIASRSRQVRAAPPIPSPVASSGSANASHRQVSSTRTTMDEE